MGQDPTGLVPRLRRGGRECRLGLVFSKGCNNRIFGFNQIFSFTDENLTENAHVCFAERRQD